MEGYGFNKVGAIEALGVDWESRSLDRGSRLAWREYKLGKETVPTMYFLKRGRVSLSSSAYRRRRNVAGCIPFGTSTISSSRTHPGSSIVLTTSL